jgi:membrane protease YdiL (CAAX protease family)
MEKIFLKEKIVKFNKQFTKKQLAFLSIAVYESIYLVYTYLIADPLSLHLGADGFLESETTPIVILFSVFLIPTLEELICRSFLNKKLSHIWVFPIFLGILGLIFYFSHFIISLIFITLILVIIIARLFSPIDKIKSTLKKYFVLFFFISSFLFAFAHIPAIHSKSIELTFSTKLFISVISLFPISIILGRIRILFGLRYSILLHCINNAMILIINSVVYS